jgi:hypothetical protein
MREERLLLRYLIIHDLLTVACAYEIIAGAVRAIFKRSCDECLRVLCHRLLQLAARVSVRHSTRVLRGLQSRLLHLLSLAALRQLRPLGLLMHVVILLTFYALWISKNGVLHEARVIYLIG